MLFSHGGDLEVCRCRLLLSTGRWCGSGSGSFLSGSEDENRGAKHHLCTGVSQGAGREGLGFTSPLPLLASVHQSSPPHPESWAGVTFQGNPPRGREGGDGFRQVAKAVIPCDRTVTLILGVLTSWSGKSLWAREASPPRW